MNKIYLEYAIEIGEYILKQQVSHEKGISWNSFNPGGLDQSATNVTNDLYSGNPGISLFFLILFVETQNPKYLETVRKSLEWSFETVFKDEIKPGFYNGSYGLVFVASKYMSISGSREFLPGCQRIINSIDPNKSLGGDIISGHSGSIVSLFQILKDHVVHIPFELIQEHIKLLFDHFSFRKGTIVFEQDNERALLGFSHGQSGIADLLTQLGQLYKQSWLINLSEKLHQFEIDLSINATHFPDFRSSCHFLEDFQELSYSKMIQLKSERNEMFAWCHGLPGIALSNLSVYEINHSTKYANRLDHFKNFYLENKSLLNSVNHFCLCHGGHGNMLFLHGYNRLLNDFDLSDYIEKFNHESFGLLKSNDFGFKLNNNSNDLSLMNGISGIGCYYLEMYSDNPLFSVLRPKLPEPSELFSIPEFPIVSIEFLNRLAEREFQALRNIQVPNFNWENDSFENEFSNSIPEEKKDIWAFELAISDFRFDHSLDYRSFLIKEHNKSKRYLIEHNALIFENVIHFDNYLTAEIDGKSLLYSTNGHNYELLSISKLEYLILSSEKPSLVIDSIFKSLENKSDQDKFVKIISDMIHGGVLYIDC